LPTLQLRQRTFRREFEAGEDRVMEAGQEAVDSTTPMILHVAGDESLGANAVLWRNRAAAAGVMPT
jgi:hypothetical protein